MLRAHLGQLLGADGRDFAATLLHESRHLIPVVLLIAAVLGSIYSGVATATEAAAVGVLGALVLSALPRLTAALFRVCHDLSPR